MKKVAAIFLLSIYMLSFAEFHHLLRIPFLIAHFEEHQQLDPGISFYSFLKLHYVGEIVVDEDYHRDTQLPFREANYCITTTAISCECPETDIKISSGKEEISNEFILYDEKKHSLLSAADIFQPPRTA